MDRDVAKYQNGCMSMEDIVAHHAASKVKVVLIQLLPHSNFYFMVNTIFYLMGYIAYNDHLRFSKQLSSHNNYMPLSTPVHQLFLLPVLKKCQWY